MPKAYCDDSESYEFEIQDRKTALQIEVEQSKWIVDLSTLLAMSIAVNATLVVLLARAYQTGLSLQITFGICVVALLASWLWTPAFQAVSAASDALLFRVRAILRIPFNCENEHILLRAIWRALRNAVQASAIVGSSLVVAQLVKMPALQ